MPIYIPAHWVLESIPDETKELYVDRYLLEWTLYGHWYFDTDLWKLRMIQDPAHVPLPQYGVKDIDL